MTAQSIVSLGYALAALNVSPTAFRSAVTQLSIEPAIRINDVAHFDEDDLERIRNLLQQLGHC